MEDVVSGETSIEREIINIGRPDVIAPPTPVTEIGPAAVIDIFGEIVGELELVPLREAFLEAEPQRMIKGHSIPHRGSQLSECEVAVICIRWEKPLPGSRPSCIPRGNGCVGIDESAQVVGSMAAIPNEEHRAWEYLVLNIETPLHDIGLIRIEDDPRSLPDFVRRGKKVKIVGKIIQSWGPVPDRRADVGERLRYG